MISTSGLGFRFGDRDILVGVDLESSPGKVVGLIGPNGSGKSTLLRCLFGSLKPSTGTVLINDHPIVALPQRQIARLVAVVPQEQHGFGSLTVAECVLLGRHPHRSDHQSFTADDRQIAAGALEQVRASGLAARAMNSRSGGERQRVLIARCLAQQCSVLLLDEPTNHLDVRYQHEVLDLVRLLRQATIVVLHDLNLAAQYCDHLVLLNDCHVVAEGSTDDVLTPHVLEPVYGIEVRRITDDDGGVHLAFGTARPCRTNGTERRTG